MELLEKLFGAKKTSAPPPTEGEITAFFVSIDSYVSLAEQLPLPLLNQLVTAYFTLCADAIQNENGTLDKYVGDVVTAFFGAPHELPGHPLRACLSALEIQRQVARLRANLRAAGQEWPDIAQRIQLRIGINSGAAIIGNLGTKARFHFTMMGDTVNLAAQLEKGAKAYGASILCTEATKAACDRTNENEIIFRSLGRILVKGRADPVELFEPVALSRLATDADRDCIRFFEGGLARLRRRDWSGAIDQFDRSAALERRQPDAAAGIDRNPSTVYSSIAASHRQNPPPPNTLIV